MAAPLIAGVDEVGRGCLAGPVVAVALILPPTFTHPLLRDSKALTPAQRAHLAALLWEVALGIGVGMRGPLFIDQHNILQATLAAMQEAVETLPCLPDLVRVDGPYVPPLPFPAQPCIRGDQRYPEIAAASIVAKVLRDQLMTQLAQEYPPYQWARNKGYPTQAHWEALRRWGPSPLHRQTFLKKGPPLG
ncbi:MAG: ribonuclease HII [Bacteroidia bacterium]|nr:MAG: ribonuclease HII [Bacteroidia bacterium]